MSGLGRSGLVPVQEDPFNAESPMEALADPGMATSSFYVRNHFQTPTIEEDEWSLKVDGEVSLPAQLSLEDLRGFPNRSVWITLECAGNGRSVLDPAPKGTPWRFGAVGTAKFTGASLADVLHRVKPKGQAVEILFEGADRGEAEPGREVQYARSLPLDVALQADTVLAWAMNDEPLAPDHGFPLRVVVPGWYGMASVKWLVRIAALTQPFGGFFQKEHYVYIGEAGLKDHTPVTTMRVRSVIARPAPGAVLDMGPHEISGIAWSGEGEIADVEVSVDDGQVWDRANLEEARSPYAASPWRYEWVPQEPGEYMLVARARDRSGNVQPESPVWNAQGYGNNAVHRIPITVRPTPEGRM